MILARLRHAIVDGLVIGLVGAGLAVAANFLSPRGLALRRDYFPATPAPSGPALVAGARSTGGAADDRETRFARRGLTLVDHTRAVELFRDPRFAEGRIVFVDARDDQHFQAGHIPGALQLDHYRVEQYATTVLPACLIAEQIVVYCNGGNCEDSELAAIDLIEFGIPASKLVVDRGGIEEWRRHGLPVETGTRGSGVAPKS